MPRPSRNLDRALLAAGRELFPSTGCAGLSVREVADAAGVNLGMFHYHFKSREAFLRALLQGMYEQMYTQLATLRAPPTADPDPVSMLRSSLQFLGRFLRANRPIVARVIADALCGEPIALAFVRENFPRHLQVIHALIALGQERGALRPMPVPQAMGFCAGSLAMPILFAGAAIDQARVDKAAARMLQATLLSDEAIDARIDLALSALAQPAKARTPPARTRRAA